MKLKKLIEKLNRGKRQENLIKKLKKNWFSSILIV